MKKNKLSILTILLLILTGFSLTAQKSVVLRYNLSQGDEYTYDINIDQDIVFQAQGQTMALDQLMDFYMTSTIMNVSDSITIKTTINRINMIQKIMGMEIKFDSDQPANEQNPMSAQIAEAMGRLINHGYTIVMDKLGNISRVDVSDMSENNELANNMGSGANFAVFPENAISVGDSWEKDIEPMETSDMKFHVKYTLFKISGNQATLQLNGTITANKVEEMEGDMNLKGETKGEMTLDIKTGWLIESKMEQDIQLDLEQNGTKFPATITGTVTATSKKK